MFTNNDLCCLGSMFTFTYPFAYVANVKSYHICHLV